MTCMDKLLTLVINLDRSPHRLAQIAKQLDDIGWHWARLPAADGKTLSMTDRSIVDVDAFKRKHGKMPLPGEVGCYLSHVWAMQRFLQTDKGYLLVMEDDLRIGPDMPSVIKALMEKVDHWDVVMLSGIHNAWPLAVTGLVEPYNLAVPLLRYSGASCYMLSRHAAEIYVRDLLPMSLPYDHEYDLAWVRGLRTRIVAPAPCRHSYEDGSDLFPPGLTKKNFHWSSRLGAYWWRIKTDLRRIGHGLAQWWRYRE